MAIFCSELLVHWRVQAVRSNICSTVIGSAISYAWFVWSTRNIWLSRLPVAGVATWEQPEQNVRWISWEYIICVVCMKYAKYLAVTSAYCRGRHLGTARAECTVDILGIYRNIWELQQLFRNTFRSYVKTEHCMFWAYWNMTHCRGGFQSFGRISSSNFSVKT